MDLFKNKNKGGPITLRDWRYETGNLPLYQDPTKGQSLNCYESADQMMAKWDPATKQRFEFFMNRQAAMDGGMTPWKREWLNKTYPTYEKRGYAILKCKLELIRRLMLLQVKGPQSVEDWVVLFMYYDGELDIPANIHQLIDPTNNRMDLQEYMDLQSGPPRDGPPVQHLTFPPYDGTLDLQTFVRRTLPRTKDHEPSYYQSDRRNPLSEPNRNFAQKRNYPRSTYRGYDPARPERYRPAAREVPLEVQARNERRI